MKRIKKPDREPDFIAQDEWRYFFDELVVDTHMGIIYNIKTINDNWYWDYGNTDDWIKDVYNDELKMAYKEWQFNKKIKDLLSESEG